MTRNVGIGGLLLWLRLLFVALCLVAALQTSAGLTPGASDGVERALTHDASLVAAPPRFTITKPASGDLKAMPTGGLVPAPLAMPGPVTTWSVTLTRATDDPPPGSIPRTRTARAPPQDLAPELT